LGKKFEDRPSIKIGAVMFWFIFPFILFLFEHLSRITHFVFEFINSISIKSEFLGVAVGFEAVLIGAAIPVSIQVITWTGQQFKDSFISEVFFNELIYKSQYFLLLGNIIFCISILLFDLDNITIILIAFLWTILNVILFYKFIKKIEYVIKHTDDYLIGHLVRHAEKTI